VSVDVDHRRAGGTAGRARCRLVVERVEVAVITAPVIRRFAIEASERSGENREFFAGVVSDDSDFSADLRVLGGEGQRDGRHELHIVRIVLEDPEVVHRIAIDHANRHLLVVVEHRFDRRRAGICDVPIGEDVTPLGIHDESRRQLVRGNLRVEGPRHSDPQNHHRWNDGVESALPTRGRALLLRRTERRKEPHDHGHGGRESPAEPVSLSRHCKTIGRAAIEESIPPETTPPTESPTKTSAPSSASARVRASVSAAYSSFIASMCSVRPR
jgi:hypothetical protein